MSWILALGLAFAQQAPTPAVAEDFPAEIDVPADPLAAAAAYGVRAEWDAAEDATSRGDLDGAAVAWQAVVDEAPLLHAASARLCEIELARGRNDAARAACDRAHALWPSARNAAELAVVLAITAPPESDGGRSDRGRAVALARGAMLEDPTDAQVARAACTTASALYDTNLLEACAERLTAIAPDDAATWFHVAVLRYAQGRDAEAEEALARASGLGLPDEAIAEVRRVAEGPPTEPGSRLPWVLAGLLGLVAVGSLARRSRA